MVARDASIIVSLQAVQKRLSDSNISATDIGSEHPPPHGSSSGIDIHADQKSKSTSQCLLKQTYNNAGLLRVINSEEREVGGREGSKKEEREDRLQIVQYNISLVDVGPKAVSKVWSKHTDDTKMYAALLASTTCSAV